MTTVYLAEPIDLTDGADARTDHLADALVSAGHNVYRPRGAWRGRNLDPRIDQVNRVALASADALVAHLPSGRASVGVPMEIEFAASLGMPALVLCQTPGQALLRPGITVRPDVDGILMGLGSIPPRGAEAASAGRLLIAPADPDASEVDPQIWPTRAYDDDAGIDLFVADDVAIPVGGFADVPCGIRVQLPEGTWGLIIGRSSTARARGLLVHPAVIDVGWRGPLFAGVYNAGQGMQHVKRGERLAQLILMTNRTEHVLFQEVRRLAPHPRGENGFGSSGV